jgi:hypothetical protein
MRQIDNPEQPEDQSKPTGDYKQQGRKGQAVEKLKQAHRVLSPSLLFRSVK